MRKIAVLLSLIVLTNSFAENCTGKSKWDLSKDKVLYVVGYAHLDTQWRWDYPTTIDQYIKATLEDNFKLFEKYPEYTFNFTGATRYEMMKEYYPAEYAKVKEYIAKGRWFVSGSSVDEGDVLAVSPESVIRQILYGNGYFQKEFNKQSCDYMLPDCFGFPHWLPSALSHCGLIGFSTQKLKWRPAIGYPFNDGVWEGPDGKSIIAALKPGQYNGSIVRNSKTPVKADSDKGWADRINENGTKYGMFADYHYYGVGDKGGAPKDSDVNSYTECIRTGKGDYKLFLTSSDQFYKDVPPQARKKMPVYKGEILLIEHSAGSITSEAYMKRWNRKNEQLADSAERAAVLANYMGGAAYPHEKLETAWKRVLSTQMHDILPGTSIPKAYEYAWNDEIIALNLFASVLENSVGTVTNRLDTDVQGKAIVVYNPLTAAREDIVEADISYPSDPPKTVAVFGPDANAVPSQIISRTDNQIKLLFAAKVPSNGYAVFDVRPVDAEQKFDTGLSVTDKTIENKFYKVVVNAAGDIESIYDKQADKQLLKSPIRLAFLNEKPKNYPAWNMYWYDRQLPVAGYVDGPADIKIVESGPVRVSLAISRKCRDSVFTQYVQLGCGDAGQIVAVKNEVEWLWTGGCLKAEFPLTVSNPKATYNMGLGTIARGNNEEKKFEVPSHEWFNLNDANSEYGVSILEDCKFGSDKPNDNTVRLTLLYTPDVGNTTDQHQYSQDWGRHDFTYAVYGHKGDWSQAGTEWQGRRLNQPLVAFESPKHKGQLGKSYSFASASTQQVDIRAIKKAEKDNLVVVRVQELHGKTAENVAINLGSGIKSAYEINGQEVKIAPAVVKDSKLVFDMDAFGIRSFAVELEPAAAKLSEPNTKTVALKFNADVFSSDNNKADGKMADSNCYPAELINPVVKCDGIEFKIGPMQDGQKNAMACLGQKITLPSGDYNKLYLLAAADEDTDGVFKTGTVEKTLSIQKWTGFIGQYDNRVWKPTASKKDKPTVESITTGFIKRDEIGWFGKHRHSQTANESYQFVYMFKYAIDLPKGCDSVVLPNNSKIKIFAATVANNSNDAIEAVCPLYDDFTGRKAISLNGK